MINIFMHCYNEEIILPHTINHYRKYLPSAKITIFDNYSTDNSAELAESLGCRVLYLNTNNEMDEFKFLELKNNFWKHVEEGWVIVCDIDEWLCLDEESLKNEDRQGSTILSTFGVDIIANSKSSVLNDINPHIQTNAVRNIHFDKKICFKPSHIKDMNYGVGSHTCSPFGNIRYGSSYLLKHMNWLGLKYKLNKNKSRFERTDKMRKIGLDIHYKDNDQIIIEKFKDQMKKSKNISGVCDCFKP